MMRKLVFSCSAILLCTCSNESSTRFSGHDSPPFTVRDSAGIAILELTGYLPILVNAPPIIQLPNSCTENAWNRVLDVAWLDSERYVALNAGSFEVFWCDIQRAERFARGREGDGPSELREPAGLWIADDGDVHILDTERRQIVRYASDGQWEADEQYASAGQSFILVGRYDDDRVLLDDNVVSFAQRRSPGIYTDSLWIHVLELSAARVTRAFGVPQLQIDAREDRNRILWPSRNTAYVAGEGKLFVAIAMENSVQQRELDGRIVRVIRLGSQVTQASDEPTGDVDRHLFVDDRGFLWLNGFDIRGEASDPDEWLIIDADGTAFVAKILLPDRYRPESVYGDRLIGVARDSMDVEYIRAYDISGVRGGRR